ncbi:alpha-tubulin N-acetyltransferase 1 isoform X1 [Esox lucius]|uniref:Alpha-tubulin N-acetyltransferase 1 n=1 Tax=Esox lucius TaxID=8010 RepID=A0AAY5KCM7_ESOLU|nr:alpha-tubulin N-acetyltransferase 1 isoform X1 [Esox lucius]XP_034150697.1 alpha-tubulin N-acetyltransferase 1 isoform X1 [Esox lucius]XP_034150698.1 alpha-tubulin N-acetyltransferase 1 isoform X1 [Esox lucius]
METTIDINHIFPERITVLDQNLIASRKSSGRSDPQPQIAAVIDELGRASAKAQHLTAPITSASKLQTNKHHLYLIKDGESKGGKGLVVGFLKVGYKKLFLLDQRGAHVETEPLCVLDFFVKEDLQRHGYGLELFEFMLQHKKVDPVMMAFDRPSPKFLSFLEKHYCLKNSVPQVNNFVVFDGFFANRSGPPLPQTDQGMYGFFGPVEKGSPQKAGRRDQALLANGERGFARGAEGTSLADESPCTSPPLSPTVGILPVLPKQGPPASRPSLGPRPGQCPWGLQEPDSPIPSHRQPPQQGKAHKPTGPGSPEQPVQSPHQHPGRWAAAEHTAEPTDEHRQTARFGTRAERQRDRHGGTDRPTGTDRQICAYLSAAAVPEGVASRLPGHQRTRQTGRQGRQASEGGWGRGGVQATQRGRRRALGGGREAGEGPRERRLVMDGGREPLQRPVGPAEPGPAQHQALVTDGPDIDGCNQKMLVCIYIYIYR